MAAEDATAERIGDAEHYRTLLEITNAVVSNLSQEGLLHAIAQSLRRVVSIGC